jgi:hypothetical protein
MLPLDVWMIVILTALTVASFIYINGLEKL